MNSRYNFRFWDTGSKRMDYDQRYCHAYIESPDPLVIMMQSTGLADKNGKEIFEGDILKDDDGDCGAVVWKRDGWRWDSAYHGIHGDCKIIGNIYENPEILK